jgi:hypothetical protein
VRAPGKLADLMGWRSDDRYHQYQEGLRRLASRHEGGWVDRDVHTLSLAATTPIVVDPFGSRAVYLDALPRRAR